MIRKLIDLADHTNGTIEYYNVIKGEAVITYKDMSITFSYENGSWVYIV